MSHRHEARANATPASHDSARIPQAKAVGNGTVNGLISDSDVRRRAYEKWERAGRPPGDGVDFWLEAKRELAQIK